MTNPVRTIATADTGAPADGAWKGWQSALGNVLFMPFGCWICVNCMENTVHSDVPYDVADNNSHRLLIWIASGQSIEPWHRISVVKASCSHHHWCINPAHTKLTTDADIMRKELRARRRADDEDDDGDD